MNTSKTNGVSVIDLAASASPMPSPSMTRRSALGAVAGGVTAAGVAVALGQRLGAADAAAGATLKGRINHSVCKWCYGKVSLEDLCVAGKKMGLQSVEL